VVVKSQGQDAHAAKSVKSNEESAKRPLETKAAFFYALKAQRK
jgi:hypothetical protein